MPSIDLLKRLAVEVRGDSSHVRREVGAVDALTSSLTSPTVDISGDASGVVSAAADAESAVDGIAGFVAIEGDASGVVAAAGEATAAVREIPDGDVTITADASSVAAAAGYAEAAVSGIWGSVLIDGDASGALRVAADASAAVRGIPDGDVTITADASGVTRAAADAEEAIEGVGTTAAGVAASLVAGGGLMAGLSTSMDAEQVSANVEAALSGVPGVSFDAGKVAGDLYADAYGESLAEVGTAVATVTAALAPLGQANASMVQTATGQLLSLEQVFGVDLAESVGAVQALISNGLAPDATAALDLIAAALPRVSGPMRDEMISAVNEYAVSFAGLGIGGEQAMAMLATATGQGSIGVDKMGDAIKEFGIRVVDNSTLTRDSFGAIGLDADEMGARFAAGGESAQAAMTETIAALVAVEDPIAQNTAAVGLFGTQMEDLGGNQGLARFATASQASLGDVSGAMAEVDRIANDTMGTGMTEAARAFEGALGELGALVRPVLEPMVGFFTALPGPVQGVVAGVVLLTAGAIALATALGPMALALSTNAAASAAAAAANIPLAATTAATGFSFAGAAAGVWAFMAPLLPLIAAVAAVVAVGVLLYQNWDTVAAVAGEVWGFITGLIGSAVGFITDHFGTFRVALGVLTFGMSEVVGFFIRHWDTIRGAIGTAVGFIGDHMGTLGRVLLAVATGGMSEVIRFIRGHWDTIVGFFFGIPVRIGNAFSGLRNLIEAPFRMAFNAVRNLWNDTVGGFGFSIPSWVPGVGGRSFEIPMMATGGVIRADGWAMVGEAGPEMLWLGRGATVAPLSPGFSGGGLPSPRPMGAAPASPVIDSRPIEVVLDLDGSEIARVLVDPLRRELIRTGRRNGGGILAGVG